MTKITWHTEKMKLGDLKEWEKNPRQLTKHDYEHIGKSIETFGLADPLIVNADGSLIGGHQRKRVLLGNGATDDTLVDVRVPDRQLNEREAEELRIRLNLNTGDWDFDILANEFEIDDLLDYGFTEYDLEIGGFDLDEEPPEDPGAQVDKAEQLREKWQTELGQIWSVGQHKIACGDCTDAEVVARLMGVERASLVWTDPPYGVKYGDKLEKANPMGYRVRTIENDDLPADELENFIRSAFILASKYSIHGAAIYAACPAGTPLPTAIASFVGSGFEFRWQLVWVKDQLVLSRADYHFRHENILYGWKPNGAHYFIDDRTQDSVWEIPRPKISKEHPTMKPVELVESMVNNSSRPNDIVYDPFLGSGTTLVACQRLNRIGRGIEISPAYVAVSLQRLADMGLEPELIE